MTCRGDGVNDGGMKVPPHMLSYVAFSPRMAVAKVADAPTALAFTSLRALTRAIAFTGRFFHDLRNTRERSSLQRNTPRFSYFRSSLTGILLGLHARGPSSRIVDS